MKNKISEINGREKNNVNGKNPNRVCSALMLIQKEAII